MPSSITVAVDPPYEVHVGAGVLSRVGEAWDPGGSRPRSPWLILSDTRVAALYADRLEHLGPVPLHTVAPGEDSKRFSVLEPLLDFMVEQGLDRHSTVVALGGGVIGDLGGLAAALYMRGIDVIQCPTTLLAQVDASVGGKTAVNLTAGKNLAGAFHQPRAVYADPTVLISLDDDELRSGLGEVLKTAWIEGAPALEALEERADALMARDPDALAEVVASCVATKARVVAADPTEGSTRAVLNLGHTFAHAIERVAGFGEIPHGIAVAVGIDLALDTAQRTGLLENSDWRDRSQALAGRLGLPPCVSALRESSGCPLPAVALRNAMGSDKKNAAGVVHLVLPRNPGDIVHGVPLEEAEVTAALEG